MRHRRDYADVSGLEGEPSNVGFLGAKGITGPLELLITASGGIGFGLLAVGLLQPDNIAWPLG
ncbi:hypothetical protein A2853_01570 [Candidatus Kaiserbacteria bacterium RIFCSPHIGHO2_01_FULL_55_17]|uniref:Uncharacterized protein n=1 Tax=Candidatus Kaiserbacteria bacterium RIFCSPHIGHO2_01_FULL_55_17 TaxID=1798484 RepID=A0A1F6D7Y2_9BACT|nr:MAG: hypothetical protein A2853_01570 [Candidatus Kaiserbacteria bacterium RIFCSPHIGHO2_01_FULL_55_17]